MTAPLHPRLAAQLGERADVLTRHLQRLKALESAVQWEVQAVARWTLRLMDEGLGSPEEQAQLRALLRASEKRAGAADELGDLGEQLAAGATWRRPA